MKRSVLGRVLSVAAVSIVGPALLIGCQAQASARLGANNPPPPPPPPATTAAPAPTPTPAPTPATPPPEAPKKLKGDVKGSKINVPGAIVYEKGKDIIKPESEPTLNQLKQFLDENPQVTQMRIEGHTDTDGPDDANMKLSGNRALAAVLWLVAKGVPRDRLIAVGFGETKLLITPEKTPADKEQNRRTEFHIATLEGKNFLGRDPSGGGTVFTAPQK